MWKEGSQAALACRSGIESDTHSALQQRFENGLGCPSAKSLNLVVTHAVAFGVLSSPLSEAVESTILSVKALGTETVC